MTHVATAVVVRLLKDDPALSPRALDIIAANDCFLTRLARKLRIAPPVEFAAK